MKPLSAKTLATLVVQIAALLSLSATVCAQTVTLENTGAPLPDGVRDRIDTLLAEEDPAETRFEARRQARRAADIVLRVLNSEGYYAAAADISVDLEPEIRPRVVFTPGSAFRFADIDIQLEDQDGGPYAYDLDLATRLQTGGRAIAKDIISEEVRLLSELRRHGYPDAAKRDRDLLGDGEAGTVDLTYRIMPGPLVCPGDITLANDGPTRPALVQRLSPIEPGRPYNADDLETLERRLVQTRMFDLADVSLAPVNGAPSDTQVDCESRNILVRLEDRSRHSVGLGASYSTSEGAGIQADWLRRNVTGRLDTLSTSLLLAELESNFELAWVQPAFRGYGRSLRLALTANDERTDAYDLTSVGLEADYDYRWTDRLTLSTGLAVSYSNEDDGDIARDFHIISGLLGATWDGSDSGLDPTQGVRVYIQGEPSHTIGDADETFIRTTSELRGYAGVNSDQFVLAARLKIGSVYGAEQTDLPVDSRFFAGGGGSVRGYAYQALGPEDADGDPIGGRSLMEASIEGRLRLGRNYGAVLFVDAGEATAQELPKFSELRAGVGVGIRYYTRFGPLRLDIATPVDKREKDDPFQLYISIGQAF